MTILVIRTDKPEAEVGLYDNDKKLVYYSWPAHRQLAETIHKKLQELLSSQSMDWPDIGGIVCYKGPGSFTGLRIGLTVANSLSYGLGVPIVGATGDDWQKLGIVRLLDGQNEVATMPEYGSEPHITKPRGQ